MVGQFWSSAAPAFAHSGGAEIANYSPASRISYTLALAASVLVAGVALLRPLTGVPTEAARRLIVTAGAAAVIVVFKVALLVVVALLGLSVASPCAGAAAPLASPGGSRSCRRTTRTGRR